MTPRRTRDLSRKLGRPAKRLSLLVFTEGQKTEPSYFRRWHREVRDRVTMEIADAHGTPMTLVREARNEKRRADKDATRGRGAAYDQIWCVFDCDQHPELQRALTEARHAGLEVAFSNPCFELWLMLHFQDQQAHIDRTEATEAVRRQYTKYTKTISDEMWERLQPDYKTARKRARALSANHQRNGSPPHANPSSGVWRLIDRMLN